MQLNVIINLVLHFVSVFVIFLRDETDAADHQVPGNHINTSRAGGKAHIRPGTTPPTSLRA